MELVRIWYIISLQFGVRFAGLIFALKQVRAIVSATNFSELLWALMRPSELIWAPGLFWLWNKFQLDNFKWASVNPLSPNNLGRIGGSTAKNYQTAQTAVKRPFWHWPCSRWNWITLHGGALLWGLRNKFRF